MNRNSLKWYLVESPLTYDFTQQLRARTIVHDFGSVLGQPLDTSMSVMLVLSSNSCINFAMHTTLLGPIP